MRRAASRGDESFVRARLVMTEESALNADSNDRSDKSVLSLSCIITRSMGAAPIAISMHATQNAVIGLFIVLLD